MNSRTSRNRTARQPRNAARLRLTSAAACLLVVGVLFAQEPKIAVEVKTVSVLATVRDKHGKIVPDLTKDAFELEEDGKPQTIDYFAKESDLPLRLALLVDTSLSQRRVLEQERTASYSFVDNLLRPDKDVATVVNFDFDITLLQDFTSSRPKLQAAFEKIDTPQFDSPRGTSGPGTGSDQGPNPGGRGGSGNGGRGHHGGGGGTHLYDAVWLASDELMTKQQGRKALVILSDGVDHGSKETLGEAIEAAQRSDTVVYSILFADKEGYGHFGPGGMGPYGGPGGHGGYGGHGGNHPAHEQVDGKKILERISKETGGRLFEVSKKETIDKIYAQIEEELRNQYSLGYTPAKNSEPGYHKIVLTTFNKDLKVQARDGYYLESKSSAAAGVQ